MTDMRHMEHLEAVAAEDVREVRRKEATYQGSWKRRGGVGAFMMMARKWDRLEQITSRKAGREIEGSDGLGAHVDHAGAYDVFEHIALDTSGGDGTVLAEVRDLRRYLLLVEAEMIARGDVEGLGNQLPSLDGVTRPGTPEDGGHHERGNGKLERLQDGLPVNGGAPPPWSFIVTESDGARFYIVDRTRVEDPGDTDHLPRLDWELNHKEWTLSPPEYRAMYRWEEGPSKWVLAERYREHWGREP